jgi:hypothetical protein
VGEPGFDASGLAIGQLGQLEEGVIIEQQAMACGFSGGGYAYAEDGIFSDGTLEWNGLDAQPFWHLLYLLLTRAGPGGYLGVLQGGLLGGREAIGHKAVYSARTQSDCNAEERHIDVRLSWQVKVSGLIHQAKGDAYRHGNKHELISGDPKFLDELHDTQHDQCQGHRIDNEITDIHTHSPSYG